MGYEVHITRGDDWASNQDFPVEESEWLDVIKRDGSLRLAGYNGPYFVLWNGDPDDPEAWLDLVQGNITTKSPGEPLLRKMIELASQLNARVQGDDGEFYDSTTSTAPAANPSLWSNPSLFALALSLASITVLAIVIPLDRFIRHSYPVGTPMPMKWALALTGLGMLGVMAWLVSTVFAVSACLFRRPSLRYALAALATNCAVGAYVALSK